MLFQHVHNIKLMDTSYIFFCVVFEGPRVFHSYQLILVHSHHTSRSNSCEQPVATLLDSVHLSPSGDCKSWLITRQTLVSA